MLIRQCTPRCRGQRLSDQLVSWVETLMTAHVFYPALGLVVVLDSLFPVIPSETVISGAGAWSGVRGTPKLFFILITVTLAAIIGDNLCYFFGTRLVGVVERLPGDSARGRALMWAQRNLNEKEVSTIIIARFIPGARWFVTIILGSVGYPWLRFLLWDSIGVLIWATQAILLGYLGGWFFQEQPLIGLVVGVGLGIAFGVSLQLAQRLWEQKRKKLV